MRRTSLLRDRLATCAALALVLATAAAVFVCPPWARAQDAEPAKGASGLAPADTFGDVPRTPMELWDQANFLIRTGRPDQAAPYLRAFLASNPDDATLLAIRDEFGVVAILRLNDDPATRPFAGPLIDRLAAASRRNATNPERIRKFISLLTKSPAEETFALERLREAGPYVVPFLVETLSNPAISPTDRARIVGAIGRLERTVVPPLIATLDSGDGRLAADMADALGLLGDPRAIPPLTFLAVSGDPVSPLRVEARRAIERLTGRPVENQPLSPVRLLTAEARAYHVHAVKFPGDPIMIWVWDQERKVPVPHEVSRSQAEGYFGLRLARQALELAPADVPAQIVFVSLALEKSVERIGFAAFPAGDSATFATAMASGPVILGQVVRTALADGKYDLAAAAVTALGQVSDADALTRDRRPNPLVEALSAPSRRTRFAAARALILLEPRQPFAGSSRVVPTLAEFVTNQAPPRVVIIDGNQSRAGQLAGFLGELGYEPVVARTGDEGFRLAAESADVELVVVDHHLIVGDWRLIDTLTNLNADARTAGIPLYVVGPLHVDVNLGYLRGNFPGIKFLVSPTSAAILERQLGGRPMKLSDAERTGYATEAANLLARLSLQAGSPFESDLGRVEPALAIALNTPQTSLAATAALGDVPVADAQRSLAEVLLDPSKPAPLRLGSAAQLAHNIQRFGPLVSADQERKLAAAFANASDASLRSALATVLGALRPKPSLSGRQLLLHGVPAPGRPAADGTPPPAPAPEAAPPADAAPPAQAVPAPGS